MMTFLQASDLCQELSQKEVSFRVLRWSVKHQAKMKAAVMPFITSCDSVMQAAKQEKCQLPQRSVYEVSLGEGQVG